MDCKDGPHFHIELIVDKKTVEIIQREFVDYVEKVGAISIMVVSHTDKFEPSDELQGAISGMFKTLMRALTEHKFQTIQ